jgi:type IV pilus assembly protein PilM
MTSRAPSGARFVVDARPLKRHPGRADTRDVFKKRAPKTSLTGLELDPGHLAAAEVSTDAGVVVTRGAVLHLAPGVLRDGEVTDPLALAEAMRTLFAEHEELPRRVRVGIANQRIVVRTIDVEVPDSPESLHAAVMAVAPDHIPMPIDEAVVDMVPIGLVQTPAGERTRVVVVAVRRELVERIAAAAETAGLELAGIDLSAFGALRALPAPDADEAVLVVSTAGLVNVAVSDANGCLFTRAAPGGIDAIASRLAEQRALTLEHARMWLAHVGLSTPLATIEGDADLVAAVRAALEEGVHELADTVRNSLNFYRTQEAAAIVERVLLTGPGAAIEGLPQRLGELLRLQVEAVGVSAVGEVDELGRLTAAAGLALSERP